MLLFEDVIPGVPYFSKRKKGRSIQEFHVVQKGETLWKIAQLYGVKQGGLRRKNRMRQTEALQEGRILYLSNKRPSDVPIRIQKSKKINKEKSLSLDRKEIENQSVDVELPVVEKDVYSTSDSLLKQVKILDSTSAIEVVEKGPIEAQVIEDDTKIETIKTSISTSNHLVMQGETLYSISKKYKMSVAQLKSWNVIESTGLKVGQVIVISHSTDLVETATQRMEGSKIEPSNQFHIVKKGDTMYSISKKYNISVSDLLLLNGKSNGALSIGDRINIKK
jgi:LysM repeat protein